MRKKAENSIRQAAAKLGSQQWYRIDKVRDRAGLVRKVFDKTLLDMARVGTVRLNGGDTRGMDADEIGNLIHNAGQTYVYFGYIDASDPAPPPEPERIDVSITGLDRQVWQRFECLCKTRENMEPLKKLEELIRKYNDKDDLWQTAK